MMMTVMKMVMTNDCHIIMLFLYINFILSCIYFQPNLMEVVAVLKSVNM